MDQKPYREIAIFVTGTTPQVVTETLYGLTRECQPPVFPNEIHVITTLNGKKRIIEELILKGRLSNFFEEFDLPKIALNEECVHVMKGKKGSLLKTYGRLLITRLLVISSSTL